MKKIVIILIAVLILLSAAAVMITAGSLRKGKNAPAEENRSAAADVLPETGSDRETTDSGTDSITGASEPSGQPESADMTGKEEDGYLYDDDGVLVGWTSDPDVDPTLNESLIKISKDPSAGISDEEAVAVAYDHAAALYGDAIRTFDLAEVSGDAYQAFVILEKTYSAADFTAHGPRCSVRVLRDGSLDFCTCGKTENVNEDALSLVTLEDVDSFVREEIAERFGDAVVGYEVWDRKAAVNDAGQTVLLLGVYCFFSETPSAELIERYGLGGSWGTDNRYGCTLEYVVG